MPMNAVEFGKYFTKLRENAGYTTQAALGKAAGVENSTISRIETGDTKNPNILTLQKLAPLLGVPIETIMENLGYIMVQIQDSSESRTDDTTITNFNLYQPMDDREIQLITNFHELSPLSQQTVLNLINSLKEIDQAQKAPSATIEKGVS
jgi:transcriptional regulator with XRE-family HTH domain